MKVTSQQNIDLLELVDVDQKISQLRGQIQNVLAGAEIEILRLEYSALAGELLTCRNQFEANETELRRAETDLATVEQRIEKDRQRLNESSSSKDIQGIESELVTLSKRKSDLEDAELALLESQEDLQSQLDEISLRHGGAASALAAAETQAEAKLKELRSQLDDLVNQRGQLQARLGSDLASIYEKRATKSVAVGRLLSGECGACRMQIGAIDLDHINAATADELVFCPECQAILVRSV